MELKPQVSIKSSRYFDTNNKNQMIENSTPKKLLFKIKKKLRTTSIKNEEECRNENNHSNEICEDIKKITNIKLKIEKALTHVKNDRLHSNFFTKNNNSNNIQVDLQTWEDFYSFHIKRIKFENCENRMNLDKIENKILLLQNVRIKNEDFSNNYESKWKPPRSPHNLIEENFSNNPWGLLIATIFLNKTSCKNARPYLMEFLKNYPDPESVLEKEPKHFEIYFQKIGLIKKRSEQIWKMSYDYLYKNWKNVNELYGIGKYGQDAFRMFCLGDLNVEPNDRFLKIYKAWYNLIKNEECNIVKKEI